MEAFDAGKVQKQFTTRAPVYDQVSAWVTDTGLLEAMVKRLEVPAESRLLDVCCGTGAVGGAFKGKVAKRVGLDLTPAMLEQAAMRLDECVQGSADQLPFEAGSFEVA